MDALLQAMTMAAAISVTRSGAAPSIPRKEEVEAALERIDHFNIREG